jgi:hypothetical protein
MTQPAPYARCPGCRRIHWPSPWRPVVFRCCAVSNEDTCDWSLMNCMIDRTSPPSLGPQTTSADKNTRIKLDASMSPRGEPPGWVQIPDPSPIAYPPCWPTPPHAAVGPRGGRHAG